MTDSPAPNDEIPRVLLIDLDNCPQQISQLPENLNGFTRIVVCYGSQEPKLPLSLVTSLAEPIQTGRLDIVGMDKKGKNAADFGLTFHAGRLMVEMPPETEFTVLSEDSDLDHAINLLRAHQRIARRVNGKRSAEPSALGIAAQEYASHSLQSNMPRPAREETLLNSIKAYVNNRYAVRPETVLSWLKRSSLLEITPEGKVRYLVAEPAVQGEVRATDDDDSIPF